MSIKIICLTAVISVLLCLGAEAAESPLTINYPPDKTVREYDLLGVSLNVSIGSVNRITVKVNGKERAVIIPVIITECFIVSLEPGVNRVEITGYRDENVVESLTREVFRRSDLISEYVKVPSDFKIDYFHMEKRRFCAKCHVMEPSIYDTKPISPATFVAEKFDNIAVIAATSTCYSCHRKIMSAAYVHGPASVWSCLSCHDSETIPEYSVKKPDTELCYSCHTEQKKDWLSKKYLHGPVNIGKCTICHSPHASKNSFNLFKSTWDLCVNCHAEKADGVHVIGDTMFKEGHPTRDREDPIRVGKELTCASCHNPHASNYPHLWAFEVSDLFELCKKCHKNYSTIK